MLKQKKIDLIVQNFINYFLEKHKNDNIVIKGIILFGSFTNPKKISKNSDLDLYLVIDNNKKRYRGIAKINNIEIDYFVNPYEQLVFDFEQAKKLSKKTIIYMLSDGKILKDNKNQLLKLKKISSDYIKKELLQDVPDFMIKNIKYFINDYIKDIQDSYEEKDFFAWQYNINLLLNYLIEVFCKKNKILLVKPKYQRSEIFKKNPNFINLYEKIISSNNKKIKMNNIKKLSNYVLDNLGGNLPEEWEVESKTNL